MCQPLNNNIVNLVLHKVQTSLNHSDQLY